MIRLIERKDGDWGVGELNKAVGLFPLDCCEDLPPDSTPAAGSSGAPSLGDGKKIGVVRRSFLTKNKMTKQIGNKTKPNVKQEEKNKKTAQFKITLQNKKKSSYFA